jgi:hypothetical protein
MDTPTQIRQARQVFDFCFADEVKQDTFQIQLNYLESDWNNNSAEDIEEFFISDLIEYHKKKSVVNAEMVNMGFVPSGKISVNDQEFYAYANYLNHHYNNATNKQPLIRFIGYYITALQPGDEFYIDIRHWLNKKERVEDMLGAMSNQPATGVTIKSKPAIKVMTLKQIALIKIYQFEPITRGNAGGIAGEYGLKGESLYQLYTKYLRPDKRNQGEGSAKADYEKIKLIKSVIPLINDNMGKERARRDLQLLSDRTGINI